jgi:hypothetical protein
MQRTVVFVFLLWILGFGAVSSAEIASPGTGRIHHVVIVWLKDHGSSEARQQYIEATRLLSKLPMVSSYRVGTALPSKRDVVDGSYDVAIVATFENAQALDEYSRHPDHDKVIDEKLKGLVDRVVVYDFLEAQ